MVIDKKTKTKIRISAIVLSISIILLLLTQQKIEIIYFTNPTCHLANNTNTIMQNIKLKFDDRVVVREINVNMYENDPPDTEEIKQLRQRYEVYGVPEIIINGKEYTKQFTYYDLEEAICNQFIIKPSVCI